MHTCRFWNEFKWQSILNMYFFQQATSMFAYLFMGWDALDLELGWGLLYAAGDILQMQCIPRPA